MVRPAYPMQSKHFSDGLRNYTHNCRWSPFFQTSLTTFLWSSSSIWNALFLCGNKWVKKTMWRGISAGQWSTGLSQSLNEKPFQSCLASDQWRDRVTQGTLQPLSIPCCFGSAYGSQFFFFWWRKRKKISLVSSVPFLKKCLRGKEMTQALLKEPYSNL